MPLNASDAMRGSPSPWKVLAMIPKQARESERRLIVSVEERAEFILVLSSYECYCGGR